MPSIIMRNSRIVKRNRHDHKKSDSVASGANLTPEELDNESAELAGRYGT